MFNGTRPFPGDKKEGSNIASSLGAIKHKPLNGQNRGILSFYACLEILRNLSRDFRFLNRQTIDSLTLFFHISLSFLLLQGGNGLSKTVSNRLICFEWTHPLRSSLSPGFHFLPLKILMKSFTRFFTTQRSAFPFFFLGFVHF